ncbi:hypothetical protein Tco_0847735 [Tanacetum coccineum]
MNCYQVECLEDDTENVPLTYHLGGDMEIQFGREEFCLVTRLRFRVDYSSEYSEGLIPFRRRVFSSARDGHAITAKLLEDKIKSKEFTTMNHNDAVSLFLLAVVECVLLGEEPRHNVLEWCLRLVDDRDRWNLAIAWCSDGKFLRSYQECFFVDARPTPRLTLDAVEARSNWWVSSKEYFDGLIFEPSIISSSVNLHNRDDPTIELYRLLEEQRRDLEGAVPTKFTMPATTSFLNGAHASHSYDQHMSSRIPSSHPATQDFMTHRPQQGFVSWSSPYQETVDPRGQYGPSDIRDNAMYRQKRVVRPSMYVQSPYTNMLDSIVPPKKLHAKSKNTARNPKVPAFDLGNAVVDDNLGDNEVAITGVVQTDEYIWYTNMDPSKVRREQYKESMTFLNNPESVYLDCHVKGFIVLQVFWRELVPSLYMSGYYEVEEPKKEGCGCL